MVSETRPLLYPYQQAWVADKARFKVGHMARQTGKTFTTTLDIVLDSLASEAAGRREPWVILSRGERQSREAMDEGVKLHLKALQAAFKVSDYEWESDDRKAHENALEVTLPGGSKITALPANPATARGFSRNVFLDEFAFHADSREIWRALFPVVSAGYKMRVTSTGNGKDNKFYEIMTGQSSVWSRHSVDIHQAVAQGLPRDVDELEEGLDDPDSWAQEYELQWLDEATAWLSYDLINSVESDSAGIPENYQGGPAYIGNDIARRRDLWVAWVWELVGDVLWTREVRTLHRASFREQDEVLHELVGTYHPRRICMDQTGMGEKPVEDAQRRYGVSRVEGVLFTAPVKQALATTGKQMFEDRKLRIPMGDPRIRKDLHSLKKLTTAAGNVRFDAAREEGSHADRAWAALLGIEAAGTPQLAYESRRVPRPGSDEFERDQRFRDSGWRRVRTSAGFYRGSV